MCATRLVHVLSKINGIEESLTHRLPKVQFQFHKHGDDVKDAEILVADPALLTEALVKSKSLCWIQATFAGLDAMVNFLKEKQVKPNFLITRLGGCMGGAMAEYVIGHIIEHERQLKHTFVNQQQKIWGSLKPYRTLDKLTIAVFGVGDIGMEVARKCSFMGMTVWGVGNRERTPSEMPNCLTHYRRIGELHEALAEADYVCSVMPSTQSTRGLFDNDILKAAANKQPVFINIGRGDLLSEESIVGALENHWLSHVILDVFPVEPLPVDSPLWTHPNVTITPHVAGLSFPGDIARIFAENLDRYCTGETLNYLCEIERGY